MLTQRVNVLRGGDGAEPVVRRRGDLLAIVLAAVVLAGCPVTFISSYDEPTDKGITALEKSVDGLLTQLDSNPVPAYKKHSYDSIRSDWASLRIRNEARPKNSLTVKQLDNLKSVLDILEAQHQAGTLNQAMLGPTRAAFDQAFRALLKLELEKKELDKKE